MQEITRNAVLVSAKGGVIDYVSPDGELLLQVAVPPGRVPASEYLDLCPDGAVMQISRGVACVLPRSWAMIQTHDMELDSGANPDFEPSSAANQERRLQMMVSRMAADTVEKTVQARLHALSQVERIPASPPVPALADDVVDADGVQP